ncbi:MAG: hypothetical protein OCD01_04510 [Fibrobacterales bacterium]
MKHSETKQMLFNIDDDIDLDFSKNASVAYKGKCIYTSKKTVGIATINEDTKCYDGVSFFKASMIQGYRKLAEDEIPEVGNDNTPYLGLTSFSSVIRYIMQSDKICAVFYGKDLHDFYEGYFYYETRHKLYMKTLTEDGIPAKTQIFLKSKISGLSFDSSYEDAIEASYYKSLEQYHE